MVAFVLAGLLALVALYFILRPLYRAPEPARDEAGLSPVETLEREKEGVYLAIRELDFDHKTGVVSDEDHKRLMARYRDRAVTLMREIDRLRRSAPGVPAEPSAREPGAKGECPNCGLPPEAEHQFCTVCGHRLSAALAVLLALALLASLNPLRAEAGEIAGKVINGTTREEVAGLRVLLTPDEATPAIAETVSGQGGRFRFEDVGPGVYVVGAIHRDVPYAERDIRITEKASRAEVSLRIYEPTTSDEHVIIRGDHLIFHAKPGGIQTAEFIILDNTGDRTYMGELSPSSPIGYGFFLALPPGYSDLNVPPWLDQRIFNPEEDGIHLALPLAPGRMQLMLTYMLPRSVWGTPLDRRLPFPVQAFNVAVPFGEELEVHSEVLPDRRKVDLNGRPFMLMAGGPFEKQATLEARIAGGLPALGMSAARVGWIAGGVLTTGLGLGWIVRRGRRAA